MVSSKDRSDTKSGQEDRSEENQMVKQPIDKERKKIVSKVNQLFEVPEDKTEMSKTSIYMKSELYAKVSQSAKDTGKSINLILVKIIEDFYK